MNKHACLIGFPFRKRIFSHSSKDNLLCDRRKWCSWNVKVNGQERKKEEYRKGCFLWREKKQWLLLHFVYSFKSLSMSLTIRFTFLWLDQKVNDNSFCREKEKKQLCLLYVCGELLYLPYFTVQMYEIFNGCISLHGDCVDTDLLWFTLNWYFNTLQI